MTLFALFFSLALVSLIGVLMLVMPALMPATLPLGVRIPHDRVGDAVVVAAIRRYRRIVGAGWAVAAVVALATAWTLPVVAVAAPLLLQLVVVLVAYVTCRAAIQHAKRDGDWYRGATVRLTADVAATSPVNRAVRPPTGWLVATLVLVGATLAAGVARYSGLPDTLTIHWGADGQPNGFAPKGVWSAFGPLIIGTITVVALYALSFVIRVSPIRAIPSDTAEQNARRAEAQRTLMAGVLGQLAFVIGLQFCLVAFAIWLPRSAVALTAAGLVVTIVGIVAVLGVFTWRYLRAVRAAGEEVGRDGTPGLPDAPDDDRYWKGGLVYVNPDDPAFLVQKRFGVGWTLNLGHPAGIAIGVGLLAVIVVAIVAGMLSGPAVHQV